MTRAALALLLLPALTACSSYATKGAENALSDTAGAPEADDALEYDTPLRFDVYPSVSLSDGLLLDQTFTVTFTGGPISLELSTPVEISGVMTGFDATPYADISVPGQEVEVLGYFQAFAPDTVVSRKVATDEIGAFKMSLSPREDYTLAWIPEDPLELPFLVLTEQEIDRAEDLSVYLDYGHPVFGQVLTEDGEPLSGLSVQAVDPMTGVSGPIVLTDRQGHYELRLFSGDYTLRVWDEDDEATPEVRVGVRVPEDEGVEQDIEYGDLVPQAFRGQVLDRDGDPVENVLVRLSSTELPGTPGGSIVLELDTPRNGIFSDDVVPGTYEVEYIPPYVQDEDQGLSPVRLGSPVTISSGSNELPAVALPERVLVQAMVIGPTGEPVDGALVRAQENDFNGYVFETVTGSDGQFLLRVSDTELTWTVQPPYGVEAATTFVTAEPVTIIERGQISLSSGSVVEGEVSWAGMPAANAVVEVRSEDGRLLASTFADEEGGFTVRVAD
ncbi:MAG: carboxypeptidase regulatory-like domain-containing protein [Alphaproteobacteria bacterium]|nr:carboxypeptidase regulatory-like domain-containing protein [Alphaproteobacteria bacterium]